MKNDPVNHPSHYTQGGGIECIEITKWMDFCLGNAFKYVWRFRDKGKPVEDLDKALWYINCYQINLLDQPLLFEPSGKEMEAYHRWNETEADYSDLRDAALSFIWFAWRYRINAEAAVKCINQLRDIQMY